MCVGACGRMRARARARACACVYKAAAEACARALRSRFHTSLALIAGQVRALGLTDRVALAEGDPDAARIRLAEVRCADGIRSPLRCMQSPTLTRAHARTCARAHTRKRTHASARTRACARAHTRIYMTNRTGGPVSVPAGIFLGGTAMVNAGLSWIAFAFTHTFNKRHGLGMCAQTARAASQTARAASRCLPRRLARGLTAPHAQCNVLRGLRSSFAPSRALGERSRTFRVRQVLWALLTLQSLAVIGIRGTPRRRPARALDRKPVGSPATTCGGEHLARPRSVRPEGCLCGTRVPHRQRGMSLAAC
jgi:hypothetical protein